MVSVHRLPVPSFLILKSTETDAVVAAVQLLEMFFHLCFEVYLFVVVFCTTTHSLYLLVDFLCLFLTKPTGNLHMFRG